jgi:hypothetical protein
MKTNPIQSKRVATVKSLENRMTHETLDGLLDASEHGLTFLRIIANGESGLEREEVEQAVCAVTNALLSMQSGAKEALEASRRTETAA